MLPLTFAADKPCDYELVVKDYWGVRSVHDIFHSSRLFLDEDALVELNVCFFLFFCALGGNAILRASELDDVQYRICAGQMVLKYSQVYEP